MEQAAQIGIAPQATRNQPIARDLATHFQPAILPREAKAQSQPDHATRRHLRCQGQIARRAQRNEIGQPHPQPQIAPHVDLGTQDAALAVGVGCRDAEPWQVEDRNTRHPQLRTPKQQPIVGLVMLHAFGADFPQRSRVRGADRAGRGHHRVEFCHTVLVAGEARGRDLQVLVPIGDRVLDDVLTGLSPFRPDGDGLMQRAQLRGPKVGLLMRYDASFRDVVVFTPANREAIAIEAERRAVEAELESDVREYCRLKGATYLLSRAIERFQARHEGPMLTTAGELFARLTCGAYDGLAIDHGDGEVPRLVGRRRGTGAEVPIRGFEVTGDRLQDVFLRLTAEAIQ